VVEQPDARLATFTAWIRSIGPVVSFRCAAINS
jgi:hypothetical protein